VTNLRSIARFSEATPARRGEREGLTLRFHPATARLGVGHIDEWVDLGPDASLAAVAGLGRVLRVLRAARIAVEGAPEQLVGDVPRVASLLARAAGTEVRLVLRRRSMLRFHAWTEDGRQTIDDVAEVQEHDDAYLVLRRGGRFPLRFAREAVIRRQTECDRWLEIVDIERRE